ncbi:MAG: biotin--[acetyl-CoA-carboxylase] ligase [Clostridia bacterium]|nr:biotin--[acetyl-CoA-carboxylase] ligase [Clostridia bacterium]
MLKDDVYRTLLNETDGYVSGEALSAKLGVSRSAIWKAVKALKTDGAEIDAVTNRGYRLTGDSDFLSSSVILDNLHPDISSRINFDVTVFKSVASTNDYLKSLAASGAPEGRVVISETQTAGKGRAGRKFSSQRGGVYMSVLLRPRLSLASSLKITVWAAVAVARAIENVFGVNASIKWVNDVFCGDKKVCGILTESALDLESKTMEYAVLGIGVNAVRPKGGFPEELKDIAGYLSETPQKNLRNRLAAEILNEFFLLYFSDDKDFSFAEYKKRLFLLGKAVEVRLEGEKYFATATGLTEDFNLIVRDEKGETRVLNYGDVSVKKS